jgi:hypothetical protein
MSPKFISKKEKASEINLLNSIGEIANKISNDEILVAEFPVIAPNYNNKNAISEISTAAGAHVSRRFRVRPVIADLIASFAGLPANERAPQ